jgi:hypothetical protein
MSAPTTTYTRPADVKIANREAWLMSAAERLWGRIIAEGGERPQKCRVSCGWPSKSALMTASSRSRVLGQAWSPDASEDKAREVFISPALADEVQVMDVLLHELIHAALPHDAGHGPAFQYVMKRVGLEGKPTATVAGEELVEDLRVIAHELGRYPHEKLDSTPGVKKPGRMVKGECPDCGNILYGSRAAWEAALPVCGICQTDYVVHPSPEQAAHWGLKPAEHVEALVNVSTTVELKTRDGRFTMRSTKSGGREGTWSVTDHEATPTGTEPRSVVVIGEGGQPERVETEVATFDPRWTIRRTREDAVAFIAAIRSGDMTWDAVELVDDEVELIDESDLDDVLGPVGEWGEDDDFLGDDEDEDALYEDGTFDGDPEAEATFEREAAKRDASGTRKSEAIIAAGGEGALD